MDWMIRLIHTTAVVDDRLGEWRRLLRQSTTQARAVLQRVLRGRIVFTPDGDGYDFEAPTRFDRLFVGCVVPSNARPAWMQSSIIGPRASARTTSSTRTTPDC